MKKISSILIGVLVAATPVFAFAQTIGLLEQWVSTTTPSAAITQRVWGKAIKLTGLTGLNCLGTDANGILGAGSCTGGSGSWPFTIGLTNYGTTTQATTTAEWFKQGFMASSTSYLVYASSTAFSVGANTFIQSSATSTFGAGIAGTYLNLSGASATSTAANGFDLAAGCFSISGTCLQTIVSSASAYKQAVRYASTSTLPSNTYSNGVGGVGATLTGTANGPFYIDGNTPTVGDRVLVKNEGTGANNGIYTVTTLGVAGLTAFVLTRATDYNSSLDVFPGVANFVNGGTVNANTCWILTNTSAVTIGTTALTYADECGAGSFTGTFPITLSGTTISFSGISTSSAPTIGNLAYWTAANTLGTVGTSTLSASSPLTGSFTQVGSGGSVGIQAATASQGGYETQNEFNYVHSATSTFSAPLVYTAGTNAVTCTNASSGVTGCMSANDWGLLHTATTTFSAPFVYTVGTNAVTCTSASAGVTGCLTGTDWSAFNGKQAALGYIPLGGSIATTYGTTTIASTTPPWFKTGYLASSTPSGPSYDEYVVMINATTTAATTTSFAIKGITSSLLTTNGNGSVLAYGGATTCTNQFFTAFSAAGASTCTSVTDATFSGQLGAAHGGTGKDFSASTGVIADYNGTFAATASSTLFGTGTGGQYLTWVNGVPGWTASTTYASPLSFTASTGQVSCPTCLTGTATDPFTHPSATRSATSTIIEFTGGLMSLASTTIGGSAATTTILGPLMVGNAAANGTLLGSTTMLQISTSTNSYLEFLTWNTNSGGNASTCHVLNNNLSTATAYYGEFCINGGGYNNPLFSGQRNNDVSILSSDGGISFNLASTTATDASSTIDFLTKGTLTANLRMRITNSGLTLIGTSTPAWGQLTIASSTGPQIALSDGVVGNNNWIFRASNNNLYFATSTAAVNGTTSPAILTFASNFGIGIASSSPQASGLTIGWGNLIMSAGQIAMAYASTTAGANIASVGRVIDWNTSGNQRLIATTTTTLQLNATSSHPYDGGKYVLKVCQDSTGGRSVTFDNFSSGVLNFSMGTPTPPTTANTAFMYGMIYDGRVGRYDVIAATSTPAGSCKI